MADGSGQGPGTPPGPVAPPAQPPAGAEMDAATDETNPQPKTITVRGKELTIPAKQPFRAIYEGRRIIAARKTGDKAAAAAALLDVAEVYLGESQMQELVNDAESVEEGFEAAGEVVKACNEAYGSAEGESSASSSS